MVEGIGNRYDMINQYKNKWTVIFFLQQLWFIFH